MKKLLVSLLLICGLVLPCFSSALELPSSGFTSYDYNSSAGIYNYMRDEINITSDTTITFSNDFDFYCFRNMSACNGSCQVTVNGTYIGQSLNNLFCVYSSDTLYLKGNFGKIAFFAFKVGDGVINFPSSLECQTEYNLIPISSVDQNYCSTNNLCPSVDCPEYPDNPNIGTSNLYINDVFHPGAFNVIINIPEEIDWDYAYTNSGSNFNLDIVGYNQDFELIEDWVATNNYKPTSDDFTNTFLLFKDYSGLLIALLFIILVFYFVKKLF